MSDSQKKKAERKITILSVILLLLLIAFMVWMGFSGLVGSMIYPVGIGCFLAVYWVLTDVFSVIWLDAFEGKTEEQKKSYYIYAILDAIGFAGLAYFVIDLDSSLGAIIFVATMFAKRRFKDDYRGANQEETQEENTTIDGGEMQEVLNDEEKSEAAGRNELSDAAESEAAGRNISSDAAESEAAGRNELSDAAEAETAGPNALSNETAMDDGKPHEL